MKLRVRRGLVIAGVAASLIAGLASIRVAAALTAAAAPPPAPPISLQTLQTQLAAEQAKSVALQGQLGELNSLTSDLSGAIGSSSDLVATDGLTAKQLRTRLLAARAKLTAVSQMLSNAQARLAKLGAPAETPPANTAVTAAPTPPPQTAPTVVQPPAASPVPTPRPQRTPQPSQTPQPND